MAFKFNKTQARLMRRVLSWREMSDSEREHPSRRSASKPYKVVAAQYDARRSVKECRAVHNYRHDRSNS